MKDLTKDQAIVMFESKEYESWSARQIVEFQLFQSRLCMPFSVFQGAVESVFGRPVLTHEFSNKGKLQDEFKNLKK
jgi:hypothetical protein